MRNKLLNSFIKYCEENTKLRFWQALRNWSKYNFIYVSDKLSNDSEVIDTYYFEDNI